MALNRILTELRNERGLSQKELAEGIGISQSAIAKIELGRNEATASTVRKLAKFFGVSTDYFLELEDDFGARQTAAAADSERELLKNFRKLPPELRALAAETIRLWAKERGAR